VAFPTEVIGPVRFALVVTVPAVNPEAVPVMFVPTKVEGVPKFGVTKVGELENTKEPVPVSSEITEASSLELVEASAESLSVVFTNVALVGIVVPFIDVAVATPKSGVTNVGLSKVLLVRVAV
jgi:hypothetical protein